MTSTRMNGTCPKAKSTAALLTAALVALALAGCSNDSPPPSMTEDPQTSTGCIRDLGKDCPRLPWLENLTSRGYEALTAYDNHTVSYFQLDGAVGIWAAGIKFTGRGLIAARYFDAEQFSSWTPHEEQRDRGIFLDDKTVLINLVPRRLEVGPDDYANSTFLRWNLPLNQTEVIAGPGWGDYRFLDYAGDHVLAVVYKDGRDGVLHLWNLRTRVTETTLGQGSYMSDSSTVILIGDSLVNFRSRINEPGFDLVKQGPGEGPQVLATAYTTPRFLLHSEGSYYWVEENPDTGGNDLVGLHKDGVETIYSSGPGLRGLEVVNGMFVVEDTRLKPVDGGFVMCEHTIIGFVDTPRTEELDVTCRDGLTQVNNTLGPDYVFHSASLGGEWIYVVIEYQGKLASGQNPPFNILRYPNPLLE